MINNLEILGTGAEGRVYSNGYKAIKILYTDESEKITKALKNINLNRVITPDKLIYENNKFIGYEMPLINANRDIRTLSKEELLNNLKLLKKDLIVLANNNILARDLISRNSLLVDDKLYFIDTSLYSFSHYKYETTKNTNLRMIDIYIKSLLSYSSGTLQGRMKINKVLKGRGTKLINEMNKNETVSEYAKRIVIKQ